MHTQNNHPEEEEEEEALSSIHFSNSFIEQILCNIKDLHIHLDSTFLL